MQRHVETFLHETFLDSVNLAHTDLQDGCDILISQAAVLELALVTVEKNQSIQHFPGLVITLLRDRHQAVSFLLLERDFELPHLAVLLWWP